MLLLDLIGVCVYVFFVFGFKINRKNGQFTVFYDKYFYNVWHIEPVFSALRFVRLKKKKKHSICTFDIWCMNKSTTITKRALNNWCCKFFINRFSSCICEKGAPKTDKQQDYLIDRTRNNNSNGPMCVLIICVCYHEENIVIVLRFTFFCTTMPF